MFRLFPNIVLSTLLSNTHSLRFFLNVSDQVSHPYKTTGKIIVLYILIFIFLGSTRNTKDSAPNDSKHWRYRSAVSLTSALEGVGDHRHAPAALPPGLTLYPLCRRSSGHQGRSGRVRKIFPPLGFHPTTVQCVASRCSGPRGMYVYIVM